MNLNLQLTDICLNDLQGSLGANNTYIGTQGAPDSNVYNGGIALPRLYTADIGANTIASHFDWERQLFGI